MLGLILFVVLLARIKNPPVLDMEEQQERRAQAEIDEINRWEAK